MARVLRTPPLSPRLHREVWRSCGWNPYPLQREILLSGARNRLTSAGRRAGKSQVGGYALVPEVFRAMGEKKVLEQKGLRREYWIVGPEYSDAEKEFRVVWDAFRRLGLPMDKPGSYNNPQSGEMRISMFDKKFIIHAKSAKYPDTLVGEGLSGVVFSEAAKLKPSVWGKFIRPTLADFEGWAVFGSTPEGRNWFYDFWDLGQDTTRLDWASWRAPSWVNPYVYGEVNEGLLNALMEARKSGGKSGLEQALRGIPMAQVDMGYAPVGIDPEVYAMFTEMSDELFNQEVQALFTEYVGRVFKNFDEELHVTDQPFDATWQTYACVDYGFTNPFVWLLVQVSPDNKRVHVIDEYYETNRTTEEAAGDIMSRGLAPSDLRMFYPDPAEPDRTRTMSKLLGVRGYGQGSIPLADRIEWIRRMLKESNPHLPWGHPERSPHLTFHRRCKNAIREHGAYRYAETAEQAADRGRPAPEVPQKKDDHTPEALGRFMSGFYGSPWKNKSGAARQSRARVGRR